MTWRLLFAQGVARGLCRVALIVLGCRFDVHCAVTIRRKFRDVLRGLNRV